MAAPPPSDRRDRDALLRTEESPRQPTDAAPTEVLPGRSTLVFGGGEGSTAQLAPIERTQTGDDTDETDEPLDERAHEQTAQAPTAETRGWQRRRTTTGSPAGSGSSPTASGAHSQPISLSDESRFASALDALRHDEIRRSRLLARFGLLMGAAVAVALMFLPGDPRMTRLSYAAIAVASLGNAWLYYLASRPDRFVGRNLAIVWVMNSIAVSAGVLYFGVFSAGSIVVLLGIYFLALGESLALALIVYLVCAGIQAGWAALIVFDVVPDPGLVHTDYLDRGVLLILEGLIQLVLLAAFVMARGSRRATLSAVTDYERVVRALAQREALLHEARQDLERALQLGGVGRFTGQTLGSFRLGSILGRGSMGEVYEAVRVATGEPAAVKLLQPASMGNPSYLMRFLREVEVAATIDVAHVVRVLEVGNASAPVPYLAMERLRGQDLAQILRDQRRLRTEQVIDLVDQAGRGITAAAKAGVVHRDLKPQNLFHAEQPAGSPIWKVLDFGVSKLLGERGTLTQGQVVGTPVYMAPEQAQGFDVDQLADLYALAAIAYRCITGHLPYRAKDVPTIMYQVVYKMPIRPSALYDVPEDVDSVLLIAMAKKPAHRFPTAQELTAALEDGLRGRLSDELRARARELASLHPWRGGP
ncbi:MAG TPA: serine/threonine-protein kinase [Kofleriaceae bacterium]|nr:serine/threonine-protein kinase [Kofleriaceae bacterium]